VLNAPSLTDSVGETLIETAHLAVVTVALARSTRSELAIVRGRGGERVGACITPRVRRTSRLATWRSRREGSVQVTRSDDALKIVDDDEEKSA
jgi:hypothetical protein